MIVGNKMSGDGHDGPRTPSTFVQNFVVRFWITDAVIANAFRVRMAKAEDGLIDISNNGNRTLSRQQLQQILLCTI
jgi:hypothetical protein